MVCEGAAASEACALSPREFFRRGAAIAVQSYTKSGVYKTNAEVLFYGARQASEYSWGANSASQLKQFEYDLGSPVEINLGGYTHNKVRLVCDPLYHRNCHRYPRDYISIRSDDAAVNNNCYDIWDVSRRFEQTHANGTTFSMRIPPGRYLIEVESIEYFENSVDATLHLRLTRQSATGPAPARARKNLRARTVSTGQEIYTFDVPLTSCGSSNLILLDLDQVRKRLWKPRQARTPVPQSVPEQESADEDFPAAKRPRIAVPPADEPYDAGWDVTDLELLGKSQQPERQGVAGGSHQAPVPSVSFNATRASPPATETQDETFRIYDRGNKTELGGRMPTPLGASPHAVKPDLDPAARPLVETYVRIPEVRNAWDSTESDSDSESSENVDNMVNFAAFPVGT